MLILTRKWNERIFIGEDIVLVVLGIENNRVKLGIEAPGDVTILREEVADDAKKQLFDAMNEPNHPDAGNGPVNRGTG